MTDPRCTSNPATEGTGAAKGTALDLRLLVPALCAWAVAAATAPWSPGAHLAVATLLGAAALGAWMVLGGLCNRRTRSRGDPLATRRAVLTSQIGLSAAACELVLVAAAGHAFVTHAGVVPDLAAERAVVRVSGVVLTEPRTIRRSDERADLVVLTVRVDQIEARGRQSTPRTPVLVFTTRPQEWQDVSWRSRIDVAGRLGPPDAPGDETAAVLNPSSAPRTTEPPLLALRWAEHARNRLRAAVDPLPVDARGLIPGLVIGDTSLTPPELTEAMLDTGMSHLSAVSGSNVAIVLGAVVVLCRGCGVRRRWRPVIAVAALVGFVVLCRPEPSVLRAAVMGVVGLIALSSSRRASSLPALGVAVLVLLCLWPELARSYGFALSTLATLGLVVFARPWGDAIAGRLPARLSLVGDAIAIPLAAQVVCAPVIVLLQGSVSTIAVLANLLAAPFVAPTTIAGIGAALVGVLWLPAAVVLAWAGALPAWLIGRIARICAEVPMGQVDWIDGPLGAWLLTGLTLAVLLTGPWLRQGAARHPYAVLGVLALLGGVAWPVPTPGGWPPPGWVVVGCDVGQGDAFVVPTGPTSGVLIDTGPEPEPVVRCLEALGIESLDAVVLSHFHSDHVHGLSGVLDRVPVGAAYVTPVRDPPVEAARTLDLLHEAGVAAYPAVAGDQLQWGPVSARVLWPLPTTSARTGANEGSVVLDLRSGRTRILFTGDIETIAAAQVRRAVSGERFDVLKVAHHGSSVQDHELVDGLGVQVAMIGVGADNTFGHPTPSALALLRQTGAVVLRTDTDGDIAVLQTDTGWAVATQRD